MFLLDIPYRLKRLLLPVGVGDVRNDVCKECVFKEMREGRRQRQISNIDSHLMFSSLRDVAVGEVSKRITTHNISTLLCFSFLGPFCKNHSMSISVLLYILCLPAYKLAERGSEREEGKVRGLVRGGGGGPEGRG